MDGKTTSVKIKTYKCFQSEFAGFDQICPINIIIGRNNSGKSSLLDLIKLAVKQNQAPTKKHEKSATYQFAQQVPIESLKRAFNENYSDRGLYGNHWHQHGLFLEGIIAVYETNAKFQMISDTVAWKNEWLFEKGWRETPVEKQIADKRKELLQKEIHANGLVIAPYFERKVFRRLAADRDIQPELQSVKMNLDSNGAGATNIIRAYISDADRKTSVITKTLLEALNKIFEPDCKFNEITIQQHKKTTIQQRKPEDEYIEHEIYLTEENKGSVELSMSGSGLKTIILVLLNMLVVPLEQRKPDRTTSDYIFAFEELENNLHPALLRRLFRYIEDFAVSQKCHFFITTHSNIVIDLFAQSPNAQIVHVTHDGEKATTQTVKSFNECNVILNDLGVRASDLLQANGIAWLEGPSDRIYFNRWVQLISNGELQEHRDYECAFFAGSLLSHFDAETENNEAIDILRINRNNILIADSDKTSENAALKPRVERMQKSIEEHGGLAWVTQAKEIENYIPAESFKQAYKIEVELPEIEPFEEFDRNDNAQENLGYWQRHRNRKTLDKIQLAKDVEQLLDRKLLENRFDLVEKMEKICDRIREWNKST